MPKTGTFIALEGIDGSGTTTQAERLAAVLRSKGHTVLCTAEPSCGPIGTACRAALRNDSTIDHAALALMFAADRLDHITRTVAPALAQGHVVLSDRYVLSSYAYQGLHLPLAWLREINGRAPMADATLLLRIDPVLARRRVLARAGVTERFDSDSTQRHVATAYQMLVDKKILGDTLHVLDAEGSVEAVTQAVCAQAMKLF
jgi:dTMP kinase